MGAFSTYVHLGLGTTCDAVQQDLQVRIDRQQVISTRYQWSRAPPA